MSARAGHWVAGVLAGALALSLLAACSSEETEPSPEPDAAPSATQTTEPPPVPRVGSCHRLTMAQATDPVASDRAVACRRPHTSVTVKVGRLAPVEDGHLLAVDSPAVRARIADSCPDDPGPLLGGDETTRRLSRFEVVWFGPSLEAADAGADWYRCDVVAVRTENELLELPARLEGVLDAEGALDRYGTCGTTAPDKRDFARVVCSEKHTWRAVDVVELPANARYLAEDVSARGDAACKDVASERAGGALEFTWSFEWPTRAQWRSGQRYGYCWVPQA